MNTHFKFKDFTEDYLITTKEAGIRYREITPLRQKVAKVFMFPVILFAFSIPMFLIFIENALASFLWGIGSMVLFIVTLFIFVKIADKETKKKKHELLQHYEQDHLMKLIEILGGYTPSSGKISLGG